MTAVVPSPDMVRHALRGLVAVDAEGAYLDASYARAVWCGIVEPGDRVAARLIAAVGPVDALRVAQSGALHPPEDVASGSEWSHARARWQPRLSSTEPQYALDAARRAGATLLQPGDPDWPTALDDLGEHAPLCLWVRGERRALAGLRPGIALVGARAASGYGEHVAAELSAALAADGVAVVSGGAYGIDGAAHRAALSVGGLTVALLAGGVDRPYPAGHAGLLADIASSGLLLSEAPCGATPTKWRFLQRNRLIAALSDATVIVEAGWRSGSLNTAGHAAALGRPLGAVPGPITSATSAGSHRLLREYDARCITSADDARELLGFHVRAGERGPASPFGSASRTDDSTRVRDALSTRVWRDPEEVARRAGMARTEVEGLLALLHLEGDAERGAGGWRMLSRAAPRR